MGGIADTIRRFEAIRATAAPRAASGATPVAATGLEPLAPFGADPGALTGWYRLPPTSGPVPMVVVLHGCTQNAASYDHGAGWSDLARRHGFAVLYPEQRRANNPNLCFNWFLDDDTMRGCGEAASIRQMIDAMTTRFAIDPARVYVTGLSAGGAMANVMLATYPELFAGGSIIAGLPYGGAHSVSQALELMRGGRRASAQSYADAVRRAAPDAGRWSSVSVWHGDADRTVDVSNADAIVDQWRTLHGAADLTPSVDRIDGQRHRAWQDASGAIAVEDYRIAGLGHGTPLKTAGEAACGHAGAYMLEAGISSTWRQAERWGLLNTPLAASEAAIIGGGPAAPSEPHPASGDRSTGGPAAPIERALRAAGLMR